ncbi:hypothetical protein [uncultured Methanobrevibacter sp.]|uniref:hypothetical protein n=1 Tax=uncultured Methanobrevibacter sp. TaxID=253161 RepID=UPI0025E81F36|nr:hypothetical protein [uncultured Methanobrevibacter sp.]
MFSSVNICLNPPTMEVVEEDLLDNKEVCELLDSLTDYFSQTNVIYDAELTVTNCEYETVSGDFGVYRKRKDYSFNLRLLVSVKLFCDRIVFELANGLKYTVLVGDDFLFFLEWEDSFYD